MAKDNFKAAAAKLQQASRLGSLARQIRRPVRGLDGQSNVPPTISSNVGRSIPTQQVPTQPMPTESDGPMPSTSAQQQQAPPPYFQPYRSPRPVKTGFGLGLGFAAGTALFRLGIFLIGVVMLLAFLAAGLDAIGF